LKTIKEIINDINEIAPDYEMALELIKEVSDKEGLDIYDLYDEYYRFIKEGLKDA